MDRGIGMICDRLHHGTLLLLVPRPRVTKPNGRKQVERRCFGSSIGNVDSNEEVFTVRFGILHEHVEISIVIKYGGVHQFVFGFLLSAAAVFFDELRVRVLALWILV